MESKLVKYIMPVEKSDINIISEFFKITILVFLNTKKKCN